MKLVKTPRTCSFSNLWTPCPKALLRQKLHKKIKSLISQPLAPHLYGCWEEQSNTAGEKTSCCNLEQVVRSAGMLQWNLPPGIWEGRRCPIRLEFLLLLMLRKALCFLEQSQLQFSSCGTNIKAKRCVFVSVSRGRSTNDRAEETEPLLTRNSCWCFSHHTSSSFPGPKWHDFKCDIIECVKQILFCQRER